MPSLFHVSARDHSAVILLSALAKGYGQGGYRTLQDIAHEMGLSEGYLEEIAAFLRKANIIVGRQGPSGGYRLAREPKQISLEDIFNALNGPLELVDCQKGHCPVESRCTSQGVWKTLRGRLQEALRDLTLAETIV